MPVDNRLAIHVVSTTHWDREWYFTFQQFRVHLVDLMDKLLDLMNDDPDAWRFMLDGQVAPLEDYLEIRPESSDEIKRHVSEGRLDLGPYYVLADEWLSSPESHIRNLQIGIGIAEKFGRTMMVGYVPDQFGHVSQTPQIMNGLGIDTAFFSRGSLSIDSHSQVWWESPDGSRVLAQNQSYLGSADEFRDAEKPLERLDRQIEDFSRLTTTPFVLLKNGSDHLEPVPHLPGLIRDYNATRPHRMMHSGLEMFFRDLKQCDLRDLPRVVGELRDGMQQIETIGSLYNCGSSRIHNKQAAHRCSTALEKWAEPFTAIAASLGEKHPGALLTQSWKYLLQNYPHDSICGCSIDRVHEQMMTRFQSSEEIADRLATLALQKLSGRVQTAGLPRGSTVFTVWNPSARKRSGLVEAVLDVPVSWRKGCAVSMIDAEGRRHMAQEVPDEVDQELRLTLADMQTDVRQNARAYTFWADDLPAIGYRTYAAADEESIGESPFNIGDTWAENEYLRFSINENGSVDVCDKLSGRGYPGLHVFEDNGDTGGGYHYEAPQRDTVVSSASSSARIRLMEAGTAMVRFRVELVMRIPERLTRKRDARVARRTPLRIVYYVSLGARSRSLEFRTLVWNSATGHRLRVAFPTGLQAQIAHVDGHFDVMERPVASDKKPWPTEYQRGWIDISNGSNGFAVINSGLPEYESSDDGTATIKLTLLRSNTHLSYTLWPNLHTPQAGMLGKMDYHYAVHPHTGNWQEGRVQDEAENTSVSLRVCQPYSRPCEDLPSEASFVSVDSESAVTSILKRASERESLVLRLYNPGHSATHAIVCAWQPIKQAFRLNLAEKRIGSLRTSAGKLSVDVEAKKIVTLEMIV